MTNTPKATSKKEASNRAIQNSSPTQPMTKKEKQLTDEQKWALGIGTVAALGIAAYYIVKGKGKQAGNQLQKSKDNLSGASKSAPDTPNPKLSSQEPDSNAGKQAEGGTLGATPRAIEQNACARDLRYLAKIELDATSKTILDAVYVDGKSKTLDALAQDLCSTPKLNSTDRKVITTAADYTNDLYDLSDAKSTIEGLLKKENGADISTDIAKIRGFDSTLASVILFQNKGTTLSKKSALKKLVNISLTDNDKVIDITKNSQGATLETSTLGQKVTDELLGYYRDLFHILTSDNISKSDFENLLKIRVKIKETRTDYHDLLTELLRNINPKNNFI